MIPLIEIARLRRSVWILRGIVLLLLAGIAGWLFARRASAPERARTVDVAARARSIVGERGRDANVADFFFQSDKLSAHLHVMGARELCPLHVHPRGVEATLIVDGSANVTHVNRSDAGAVTRRDVVVPTGGLVVHFEGAAHAFDNPRLEPLANLVFSSPAFDHNTYLSRDDDDRLGDLPPIDVDVDKELSAFLASTEPSARRRISSGRGGLAVDVLFVRRELTLAPHDGVTLLYVVAGTGTVGTLALAPKVLAILEDRAAWEVHAVSPLAVVTPVLPDAEGPERRR